jgi:uncharacterized repeat protein (TIGR04138 family)
MADTYEKSLRDLATKVGDYPEDAYHFVREGSGFAVTRVHGPESPAQIAVMRYLAKRKLDLAELLDLYERGDLSPTVMRAVEEAGGIEKLNRHVTGGEMCWGLRDYAQHRWGLLARTVLNGWNIHHTFDFGRLVFAMIDYEFMQSQPSDSIEDFRNVFDFREAFDLAYEIHMNRGVA